MHPFLSASQTVFHPGEQLVQDKVGVRQHVLRSGMEDMVRGFMPDQHRRFFEQQPLLYLGSRDASGRPWATVLAGRPGFLATPDAQHLIINPVKLPQQDPLATSLKPGAHLGMLGMELHTRRRNRLNGIVSSDAPGPKLGSSNNNTAATPSGGSPPLKLAVDVSLSFGNCPKYIQGRKLDIDWDALDKPGFAKSREATSGGSVLGSAQQRIVQKADTFFIASCYDGPAPAGIKGSAVGCDLSHRGGPRGFLKLTQGVSGKAGGTGQEYSILRWADYKGNNMFQTLGNLMLNPKAGLLIIDFETGDTLHMTGEASIDFEDQSLPGALRTVSFRLHSYVHIHKALPLRQMGAIDWSPFLPTGGETDTDGGEEEGTVMDVAAPGTPSVLPAAAPKTRVQVLECISTVAETHDVTTFEFKLPPGANPAKAYTAGQYATFQFPAAAVDPLQPAGAAPAVRTWTISSHPSYTAKSGTFTISVKRAGPISMLLHNTMKPGGTVALVSFGGDFVPNLLPADNPAASALAAAGGGGTDTILLLAGGIGITPLRAMLHDFVLCAPAAPLGVKTSERRLVLFYSIKAIEDAAFVDELASLAQAANRAASSGGRSLTVQLVLNISQGSAVALAAAAVRWPGAAVHDGRLSRELLLRYGGASDAAGGAAGGLEGVRGAFMCGPPGFMAAAELLLKDAGLDAARLFTESFSF